MTNFQRNSLGDRDVDQAITALKRGSYLLKYGRRGKPKFCPFRLSNDEVTLKWYAGKEEKQLRLTNVSQIIPGQRTAITALKRGSYLLKYGRRGKPKFCPFRLSNDEVTLKWYAGKEEKQLRLTNVSQIIPGQRTICKDKDEAEIWFVALRALISRVKCQQWRSEARSDSISSDSSRALTQRNSQSIASTSSSDIVYEEPRNNQTILVPFKSPPQKRLGRTFSDVLLYNEVAESPQQTEFLVNSLCSLSSGGLDDPNGRSSSDTFRVSLSGAISLSSQGSSLDDFDTVTDIFIWGEGIGNGLLGGGVHRVGKSSTARVDAHLPKALESTFVFDAQKMACGSRHAVLVTKQGEIFSWGEGSGGKLGHGVEADVSNPKVISTLSELNIESVACGEYHTCAVTLSGDLYTWGDGIHNFGLLGHGAELSHWTPKKVMMEDMCVSSISCGPWHTAAITSVGQLFTFGDGTFGALGHGNCRSTSTPRQVETLKGLWTLRVSCGYWHTAAVVDVTSEPSSLGISSAGKLFTWGSGDKGQLGHGDKEPRLVPSPVKLLDDTNFCQVACGHSNTIALTNSGKVYTMGNADHGQLGSPGTAGILPTCIEGKIRNNFIEEISCGSHHVAVLSSKYELYTWGKGTNGQLGHGDNDDRNIPTLVEALKDKQVNTVVCGSNFTAAICLHKRVYYADHSICSSCRNPFSFRRKRHNCYNCGLLFCKSCSSNKSLYASLSPNMDKPYRVCDDCFIKLNKGKETGLSNRPPKVMNRNIHHNSGDVKEKGTTNPKSHGLLSRLSSFDSFRRANSHCSKQNHKVASSNGHVSPIHNRSFQRGQSFTSNSSTSIFECSEDISASIPGSMTQSRGVSPISVKLSPPRAITITSAFATLVYPEVISDVSKLTNDDLTQDISILREQVELLTRRSKHLEAELERTSRQLDDATELARDQAEKNNAAKEVIKSLMKQLKDMAVKVPQGSTFCRISGSLAENTSSTLSLVSPLLGTN
ncbi:unnamed protein product [Ilex paraguariensis]|uniref:FYVE-type domain-containing protein n=1 Tax=Ilex paraguariensis TaxID=185542 RepID=A0ABC8QZ90_9AQUA